MEKKVVIGVVVCLLISGAVTGWLISRSLHKEKTVSPFPQEEYPKSLVVLPSEVHKEYVDSAGFSFKYSEDLAVESRAVSDAATYTDVEITSSKVPGGIVFKAVDTTLAAVNTWFKEQNIATSTSREIILAGIAALEVKENDTILVAAIDQGVLFTIEVLSKGEDDYWESVYTTLVSTFSFTQQQTAQVRVASGSGNSISTEVIFEGEETIE